MNEKQELQLAQLRGHPSPEELREWEAVLEAGVKAQSLIRDGVVVGGTAAALYAGHRVSFDTDHLLMHLRDRFEDVLEILSESPEWKTARTKRPVLILGSLNDVEVGFRQSLRTRPIETLTVDTRYGPLVIPTLDEMIGMKAFLAYRRNATRDFLDFAALSLCAGEEEVVASLLKSDARYGELQTASVALEIAKTLAKPEPYDLSSTDLSRYKALAPEWHDWSRTESICQHYGKLLGERLVKG
jgi:hypothetical protein